MFPSEPFKPSSFSPEVRSDTTYDEYAMQILQISIDLEAVAFSGVGFVIMLVRDACLYQYR